MYKAVEAESLDPSRQEVGQDPSQSIEMLPRKENDCKSECNQAVEARQLIAKYFEPLLQSRERSDKEIRRIKKLIVAKLR